MKRFLVMCLCTMMAASLAACSNDKIADNKESKMQGEVNKEELGTFSAENDFAKGAAGQTKGAEVSGQTGENGATGQNGTTGQAGTTEQNGATGQTGGNPADASTEGVVEVSLEAPEMRMIEVGPIGNGTIDFAFEIPETWTVTVDYQASDDTWFAEIHPNGTESASIVFELVDSFGVCGTGLKEEEITLNGYKAIQGTYDDRENWDFIVFTGDLSGCAIYNTCSDSEWQEYRVDINTILGSFTCTKCRHEGENHGEHAKNGGQEKLPEGV